MLHADPNVEEVWPVVDSCICLVVVSDIPVCMLA